MPKSKTDKQQTPRHTLFSSNPRQRSARGSTSAVGAVGRKTKTSSLLATLAAGGNPITTSDQALRTDHVGQLAAHGHQTRDMPGVTLKHQVLSSALRAQAQASPVKPLCNVFQSVRAYVPDANPEIVKLVRLGEGALVLDAFQATHIISQSAKWKHDKRLEDLGVVSAREQHVVPMQWLEDSLEKQLLQNEALYLTKR